MKKSKTKQRDTTLVRLSRKAHRLLKVEAAKRGVSMSELATEALQAAFGGETAAA